MSFVVVTKKEKEIIGKTCPVVFDQKSNYLWIRSSKNYWCRWNLETNVVYMTDMTDEIMQRREYEHDIDVEKGDTISITF